MSAAGEGDPAQEMMSRSDTFGPAKGPWTGDTRACGARSSRWILFPCAPTGSGQG